MKIINYLIDKISKPPFEIGDIVRFEPDEHALGWLPPKSGLYYGYVGKVTRLVRGTTGIMRLEWDVYLDDKDVGFSGTFYKLVRKGSRDGIQTR
jgi:hypothetical protein